MSHPAAAAIKTIGAFMLWKKKEQPQGNGITVQTGVVANALTIEALISVLIRKNICTKDEILAEIKVISDATRARSQQPH